MKLPTSFIPNKDLEKKTLELIEGPKLKKLDPEINVNDIETKFRIYDDNIKKISPEEFYKITEHKNSTIHKTMKKVFDELKDSPKEFNVYSFDGE